MSHGGYRCFTQGKLFMIRWSQPSVEAAAALAAQLETYHAEVGEPLVFVFLIGPESPIPDRATREALLRGHARIHELTLAARNVILPGSLRQRLMQRVLVGMRMALVVRGQAFHHHAGADDLLDALETEFGFERPALERELIDAEMLLPTEVERGA